MDWWGEWRQLGAWLGWTASVWNWEVVGAIATAAASVVTAAATLIAFRALRANEAALAFMRDQVALAREQTRLTHISTASTLEELERLRQPNIIPVAEPHERGTAITLLNAGQHPLSLDSVNIQYSNLNGEPLGDISTEDWSRLLGFEQHANLVMPGEKQLAFLLNPVKDYQQQMGEVLLLTQFFRYFSEPIKGYSLSITVPVVTQHVRHHYLRKGIHVPGHRSPYT